MTRSSMSCNHAPPNHYRSIIHSRHAILHPVPLPTKNNLRRRPFSVRPEPHPPAEDPYPPTPSSPTVEPGRDAVVHGVDHDLCSGYERLRRDRDPGSDPGGWSVLQE